MLRYEVGFDPALAEIISEVKYLDQLGFEVPQDAKTVALLEDQYVLRVSALKQMLKRFHDVLDILDLSQVRSAWQMSHKYVCITTYQPDSKSNPNSNSNPNPNPNPIPFVSQTSKPYY